jgi:probable rRNA maturation factor
VDPDSRRVSVTVTDGRGRRVAGRGLARWLAAIVPARLQGEVAIALVTDAHIRKLNRQYRGKDYATDVLSFSPDRGSRTPDPGPRFIGDIVIATGVAKRQAREAGHSYQAELRVLALHGFLHLLGYDHDDPDDHGRMARAEARLRRRGGLSAGLIARAGGRPRPARAVRGQRRAAAPAPLRQAQGRPEHGRGARAIARGWGPARIKQR